MSTSFSWNRVKAIAKKETFHIFRDPYTLAIAIFLPLFMVLMYGFAIDFNIKNVPLGVNDFDKTQESRTLINTFRSSGYFIIENLPMPANIQTNIESEKSRAGLIIPPNFGRDIGNGRNGAIQIMLDGADNSSVGPIAGYLGGIQSIAVSRLTDFDQTPLFKLKTRYLFNPELNSKWFTIPGLIVVVMTILSVLLTALTIAREWENGSMELLLSTPVKPIEIILGKLAPYAGLGILTVLMIFTLSFYVFDVPFKGNPIVFAVGYCIFTIAYLAQGLLISILTKNQQIALQFASLTGFLPSQLLSGFIFPIASMPIFFGYFTMIFPARWFLQISRDVFLKDTHFHDLLIPFGMLSLLTILTVVISVSRFKRTLE